MERFLFALLIVIDYVRYCRLNALYLFISYYNIKLQFQSCAHYTGKNNAINLCAGLLKMIKIKSIVLK
jgi:hypothetical protein